MPGIDHKGFQFALIGRRQSKNIHLMRHGTNIEHIRLNLDAQIVRARARCQVRSHDAWLSDPGA